MLEQLFGIRYTTGVAGRVFGYYLSPKGEGYAATVVEILPTGKPPIFGVYHVPTVGHKESVNVAILDQMLASEGV